MGKIDSESLAQIEICKLLVIFLIWISCLIYFNKYQKLKKDKYK